MHVVTPTGVCLVSSNLIIWANLQSQSIVYNRKRNLILIFLWWPLSFLIHSATFFVSGSFCVLLAMMVFWLSSQGVILISCSCCCSHTTWIYRWFVCDCLDNICYNFFPECQLKESIYLAQLLISAVCQKHWSSAQERVNFPSFHSLSRSSAGADLGGVQGVRTPSPEMKLSSSYIRSRF